MVVPDPTHTLSPMIEYAPISTFESISAFGLTIAVG